MPANALRAAEGAKVAAEMADIFLCCVCEEKKEKGARCVSENEDGCSISCRDGLELEEPAWRVSVGGSVFG